MDFTYLHLNKTSDYVDTYTATILSKIQRHNTNVHIKSNIPMYGCDVWNCYEISWLNEHGKPEVCIGRIVIPVNSPYIVESKSLKLYLNSFNNTIFISRTVVKNQIREDLEKLLECTIDITLTDVHIREENYIDLSQFECIDDINIDFDWSKYDATQNNIQYLVQNQSFIAKEIFGNRFIETIYSNLLRSRCPVTGQPDFATLVIKYDSYIKINRENLLRYIISFRNHQAFHETCIEKIYLDIQSVFTPRNLLVYAHYLRRGGIDICPYRTTKKIDNPLYIKFMRQ